MKEKVVVVIGPTAVGKTKLSIELAKTFNGEVISGDSMQVYREMNIGTAKVTPEEMDGVPHHLIDIKEPTETFSAAEFQKLVKTKITDINKRGKIPVIAGGTGLYIQSVLFDYSFSDASEDKSYRDSLEKLAEEKGKDYLYQKLEKIDPESAKNIHPNNLRRVIRALEIYKQTGQTMTEYQKQQTKTSPYDYTLIGLTMERDELYNRINHRVDLMVEEGLIEEAKQLYNNGVVHCQSIQAIGYKEVYEYIEGQVTKDEAIEKLKRNTRRFAKRQFTWFRNQMDVKWFEVSVETFNQKQEEILQYTAGMLKEKSN